MSSSNNLFEFNKSLIKLSSSNVLNNLKLELDSFLNYLEKQYTDEIDVLNNNLESLLSCGYMNLLKIISLCQIYVIKEQNETKKYLFEKISSIKISIDDFLDKLNSIKMKNIEVKIKKNTENIKINKEIQQKNQKQSDNNFNDDIKQNDNDETNIKLNQENLKLNNELLNLNQIQYENSLSEIINSYNHFINHYVFIMVSYKEIVYKIN